MLPATRLASHLFMPTGDSRSIEGLGQMVESIHFTEPDSISVTGTELTANSGGISCLRFLYREKVDDNTTQTLCVMSFDEIGSCDGLGPLTLDLEQFSGPDDVPLGNSNLLEYGDGLFYGACLSPDGKYRLQQPDQALPPLYFTIVDALGDGQYSLGDPELERQRQGAVTTFFGEELRPPWIVTVSREIHQLQLTDDLRTEFNDEDCSLVPSCSTSPDVILPGDILRIGVGLGSGLLADVYTSATPEVLDRFFLDRIGIGLEEFAEVHPDAATRAFERLVGIDVMDQVIRYFGELYQTREKGVVIGYGQTHSPIPFPYACAPDEIAPGESERCQRIEDSIAEEEMRRIKALQDMGYGVWLAAPIDYRGDLDPAPFADLRPHFSLFDGVIAGIGANSDVEVSDVRATLAESVRQFAQDVGSDTPVILTLNGPPVASLTGRAGFCEADICPSDFKGMFDQTEAVLDSALRHLSPGQFDGFGVALFEGAHFDIREPYERYQAFDLNRVGETGYNNPVLNIYRAGLSGAASP